MYELSLIVPCYNASEYVNGCVEKIEQQVIEGNVRGKVEIVLIDDGSTDDTPSICADLAATNENVEYYYHADENGQHINLGVAATRNLGIDSANGKWIGFVDVDDCLENNAITEVIKQIEKSSSDMELDAVLSGFVYDFGDEKILEKAIPVEEGYYTPPNLARNFFTTIEYEVLSCVGGKFYKKSFLDSQGIRFRTEYKFNEDGGFIVDILSKAKNMYILSVNTYRYVQRGGSRTYSYRYKQHRSELLILKRLYDFLTNCGVGEDKKIYIAEMAIRRAIKSLTGDIKFADFATYSETFDELREDRFITDSYYVLRKKIGYAKKMCLYSFLIVCNCKSMLRILLKKSIDFQK